MNRNIVHYAVEEIRQWEEDTLIGVTVAALKLLGAVMDSGHSPTDSHKWRELRNSLNKSIACHDDAREALAGWDSLSGDEFFVDEHRDDRLSKTKLLIIAFVVRSTVNRFSDEGHLRELPFAVWKNRLCSAIETNGSLFMGET